MTNVGTKVSSCKLRYFLCTFTSVPLENHSFVLLLQFHSKIKRTALCTGGVIDSYKLGAKFEFPTIHELI
jgi:hypothetical protein